MPKKVILNSRITAAISILSIVLMIVLSLIYPGRTGYILASADEVKENAQGVLFANTSVGDASFSDMFQGDEVTNKAYVDVAKLQMFFFTVIAGLTYGVGANIDEKNPTQINAYLK